MPTYSIEKSGYWKYSPNGNATQYEDQDYSPPRFLFVNIEVVYVHYPYGGNKESQNTGKEKIVLPTYFIIKEVWGIENVGWHSQGHQRNSQSAQCFSGIAPFFFRIRAPGTIQIIEPKNEGARSQQKKNYPE